MKVNFLWWSIICFFMGILFYILVDAYPWLLTKSCAADNDDDIIYIAAIPREITNAIITR